MANRTVKYANSVHGSNPQFLIEKIVRERIYDSRYWHENCFLLTSALVLEKAVDDLRYLGGTYGTKIDPTPFLCLVLKLLQIQPEKEIIYLYIEQNDFKYLRALGAFYLRLTGRPAEIYTKLEPLYNDFRKLRVMDNQRNFSVLHMDEFIDSLLHEEKVFNITIPRLTKRYVLEDNRDIEPYKSQLEEQDLIPKRTFKEKTERHKEADHHVRSRHDRQGHSRRSRSPPRRRSRSSERDRHHNTRERDRDRHHRDRRSKSRSKSPVRVVDKVIPSKYTSGKGRFSRQEIENENAIRTKVGLRPLR